MARPLLVPATPLVTRETKRPRTLRGTSFISERREEEQDAHEEEKNRDSLGGDDCIIVKNEVKTKRQPLQNEENLTVLNAKQERDTINLLDK